MKYSLVPRTILVLLGVALQSYGQATMAGNVVIVQDDGSIVGHDNLFNLDGHSIRFTPAPSGGYDASLSDLVWNDDRGDAIVLDLPQGQSTEVPLGFSFPFAGKTWNSVVVNSTGNLTFGWREDNISRDRYFLYDDLAASLVAGSPTIAPFWRRFYGDWAIFGGGNQIQVKQGADYVLITWNVAELYDNPQSFSSQRQNNLFQARLASNGEILFSYNGIQTLDGVVGVYPGPKAINPTAVLSQTQRQAKAKVAPYLAITDARVEQSDDLTVRLTYTLAAAVPAPRPQLFYRFYINLKPPFVAGPINFSSSDCEIDVAASGNVWTVRPCKGTASVQVADNKVSVTVPLSLLNFPAQFNWFGDTVDFAQTGQFDQVGSLVAAPRESSGNREVHLLSALPATGVTGAIYESFHYPVFKSGDMRSASESITKLYYKSFPDAVDFLLLFTDFRFDSQEAASTSFWSAEHGDPRDWRGNQSRPCIRKRGRLAGRREPFLDRDACIRSIGNRFRRRVGQL